MSLLAVAVVVIALLAVVNLLLTLALARKVAAVDHGPAAGELGPQALSRVPENRLADGSPVPTFRATTRADGVLDHDALKGATMLGFFSTTCRPCREQAPDFARRAATFPGGREQVVAVVKGGGSVAEELAALLGPVARVVVESGTGNDPTADKSLVSLSEAFGITRWPSYVEVDAAGQITNRLRIQELFAAPLAV